MRPNAANGIEGALVEEHGLPQELQEILNENDLRRAMEVIKQETGGDNVLFFVIMKFVI